MQEPQPVTEWLEQSFTDAVSQARMGLALTDLDRVHGLVKARAGQSPISLWGPGELARLTRLTEDEVHAAVEAGIEAMRYGADSHPQAFLLLENFSQYVDPPEPSEPMPGQVGFRVKRKRDGTWTTAPVIAKGGES